MAVAWLLERPEVAPPQDEVVEPPPDGVDSVEDWEVSVETVAGFPGVVVVAPLAVAAAAPPCDLFLQPSAVQRPCTLPSSLQPHSIAAPLVSLAWTFPPALSGLWGDLV